MQQYLDLARNILDHGIDRQDRTGVGTRAVFGRQMRFDLSRGFPMMTTKRLHFKSVALELLWFLRGDTNINWLQERGVRIWNEWADEKGELGPVYGKQWRSWDAPNGETLDQIARLIDGIKNHPDSRRHIVSAWNPADVEKMALPPCHCLFQFFVAQGKLSCQLYQRSADLFLGVPFNIASYALLTHMVAQICDLEPGDFVHNFGDVHIYHNHFDQIYTQLGRAPENLPSLWLNPDIRELEGFTFPEDIKLENYEAHPHIAAKVAV